MASAASSTLGDANSGDGSPARTTRPRATTRTQKHCASLPTWTNPDPNGFPSSLTICRVDFTEGKDPQKISLPMFRRDRLGRPDPDTSNARYLWQYIGERAATSKTNSQGKTNVAATTILYHIIGQATFVSIEQHVRYSIKSASSRSTDPLTPNSDPLNQDTAKQISADFTSWGQTYNRWIKELTDLVIACKYETGKLVVPSLVDFALTNFPERRKKINRKSTSTNTGTKSKASSTTATKPSAAAPETLPSSLTATQITQPPRITPLAGPPKFGPASDIGKVTGNWIGKFKDMKRPMPDSEYPNVAAAFVTAFDVKTKPTVELLKSARQWSMNMPQGLMSPMISVPMIEYLKHQKGIPSIEFILNTEDPAYVMGSVADLYSPGFDSEGLRNLLMRPLMIRDISLSESPSLRRPLLICNDPPWLDP